MEVLDYPCFGKEKEAVELATAFIKTRLSEKEYDHSIRISQIIAQKGLSYETVIAALLHDTIYSNKSTFEEIEQLFGKNVAEVVNETAIIEKLIETNFPRLNSETITSLILSTSSDLQTIFIQMAELSDLLEYGPTGKYGKRLVRVVREIYVPLSLKLGISRSNWKLEDDCFKIDNPAGYEKVKKLVNKTREVREELTETVIKEVEEFLKTKVDVQVSGRPKNFAAIHEKMKKTSFKNINDLYGIRIICNKDKDCYEVLGYIHSKYRLLPDAFDDYIAKPKGNGYKSIHTAIERGKDIIEFQIRTWEQHLRIESNLYWEYKKLKQNRDFEKSLSWERQLVEWQKSIGEEVTNKKNYSKRIYTFTPKGEVIPLPKNATVIDFAFAIHTDIGKKTKKAKVNGVVVPLETPLNNLDKVEIILDKKTQIKEVWLSYVKTEKAKTKIKQHFGFKTTQKRKTEQTTKSMKKIKLADCCNPLPGEEIIGVKTTKRKIIIHKKDCINLKRIPKEKLIEISFETNHGKTTLLVGAVDRIGLLGEILKEISKSGGKILKTNFDIKKTGYIEAEFTIDIKGIEKLEHLMEKLAKLPSIQRVERR